MTEHTEHVKELFAALLQHLRPDVSAREYPEYVDAMLDSTVHYNVKYLEPHLGSSMRELEALIEKKRVHSLPAEAGRLENVKRRLLSASTPSTNTAGYINLLLALHNKPGWLVRANVGSIPVVPEEWHRAESGGLWADLLHSIADEDIWQWRAEFDDTLYSNVDEYSDENAAHVEGESLETPQTDLEVTQPSKYVQSAAYARVLRVHDAITIETENNMTLQTAIRSILQGPPSHLVPPGQDIAALPVEYRLNPVEFRVSCFLQTLADNTTAASGPEKHTLHQLFCKAQGEFHSDPFCVMMGEADLAVPVPAAASPTVALFLRCANELNWLRTLHVFTFDKSTFSHILEGNIRGALETIYPDCDAGVRVPQFPDVDPIGSCIASTLAAVGDVVMSIRRAIDGLLEGKPGLCSAWAAIAELAAEVSSLASIFRETLYSVQPSSDVLFPLGSTPAELFERCISALVDQSQDVHSSADLANPRLLLDTQSYFFMSRILSKLHLDKLLYFASSREHLRSSFDMGGGEHSSYVYAVFTHAALSYLSDIDGFLEIKQKVSNLSSLPVLTSGGAEHAMTAAHDWLSQIAALHKRCIAAMRAAMFGAEDDLTIAPVRGSQLHMKNAGPVDPADLLFGAEEAAEAAPHPPPLHLSVLDDGDEVAWEATIPALMCPSDSRLQGLDSVHKILELRRMSQTASGRATKLISRLADSHGTLQELLQSAVAHDASDPSTRATIKIFDDMPEHPSAQSSFREVARNDQIVQSQPHGQSSAAGLVSDPTSPTLTATFKREKGPLVDMHNADSKLSTKPVFGRGLQPLPGTKRSAWWDIDAQVEVKKDSLKPKAMVKKKKQKKNKFRAALELSMIAEEDNVSNSDDDSGGDSSSDSEGPAAATAQSGAERASEFMPEGSVPTGDSTAHERSSSPQSLPPSEAGVLEHPPSPIIHPPPAPDTAVQIRTDSVQELFPAGADNQALSSTEHQKSANSTASAPAEPVALLQLNLPLDAREASAWQRMKLQPHLVRTCTSFNGIRHRSGIAYVFQRAVRERVSVMWAAISAEHCNMLRGAGLLEHLTAMRGVFFLERGNDLLSFTAPLFRSMRETSSLSAPQHQNSQILTSWLHKCDGTNRQVNHLRRFVCNFEGYDQSEGSNILLHGFRAIYKMPAELHAPLGDEYPSSYNKIFGLMLRLKYTVSWLYDQRCESRRIFELLHKCIRSLRGHASPLHEVRRALHQLQCAHQRVGIVCKTVHDYLSHAVITEQWAPFVKAVTCATQPSSIRAAHDSYLRSSLRRCFLLPEQSAMLAIVLNLFSTADKFLQHLSQFHAQLHVACDKAFQCWDDSRRATQLLLAALDDSDADAGIEGDRTTATGKDRGSKDSKPRARAGSNIINNTNARGRALRGSAASRDHRDSDITSVNLISSSGDDVLDALVAAAVSPLRRIHEAAATTAASFDATVARVVRAGAARSDLQLESELLSLAALLAALNFNDFYGEGGRLPRFVWH